MKTKEISTNVINTIKKNDKLAEQLEKLENIVNEIYERFASGGDDNYRKLIYKNYEGEELPGNEDFWSTILDFIELNQNYLQKESEKLIK